MWTFLAGEADNLRMTQQVAESCRNHDLTDSMVIGTSALAQYDIDGAVGMYSGVFNNPFLIWQVQTASAETDIDGILPVRKPPTKYN